MRGNIGKKSSEKFTHDGLPSHTTKTTAQKSRRERVMISYNNFQKIQNKSKKWKVAIKSSNVIRQSQSVIWENIYYEHHLGLETVLTQSDQPNELTKLYILFRSYQLITTMSTNVGSEEKALPTYMSGY